MHIYCNTVTYNIPFAFKDPKDIRDEVFINLDQIIQPSKQYMQRHGDSNLMIIIALDLKPKELEVRGPTTGDNLVDYTIWMPYKRIKNSPNYRIEYLKALVEGLTIIFSKYSMDTKKLEALCEKIGQNWTKYYQPGE